jgi:hypothetical protein
MGSISNRSKISRSASRETRRAFASRELSGPVAYRMWLPGAGAVTGVETMDEPQAEQRHSAAIERQADLMRRLRQMPPHDTAAGVTPV